MKSVLLVIACIGIVVLACCDEGRGMEPPEIRLGVAPCAECGMIVSEEPYATAVVVKTSDGQYQAHAFDDFNCMLEFAARMPGSIVKYYVHERESRAWLDAADAFYVHSVELQTPMASGLAACQSLASAQELLELVGGDVLSFQQVMERHDAGHLSTLWLREHDDGG